MLPERRETIRQILLDGGWWCGYKGRLILIVWGPKDWLEELIPTLYGFLTDVYRPDPKTGNLWINRGGASRFRWLWRPDEGTHETVLRWILEVMIDEKIGMGQYRMLMNTLRKNMEARYENSTHRRNRTDRAV